MTRATSRQAEFPASLQQFDRLPDSAGVPLPVVRALYGNPSPATIWRWSANGRIPRPYKAGPNRTLWNVGRLRENITGAQSGKR
jgi:hypothetical protein